MKIPVTISMRVTFAGFPIERLTEAEVEIDMVKLIDALIAERNREFETDGPLGGSLNAAIAKLIRFNRG